MFFLAGLMGMMALGSVALVSTGALDEDEEAAPDSVSPQDAPVHPGHSGEGGQGTAPATSPAASAGTEQAGDIEAVSLFSRMGLINMPGLDAGGAAATPAPVGDVTGNAAEGASAPTAAPPGEDADDLGDEGPYEDAFKAETGFFDAGGDADPEAEAEAEDGEGAQALLHGDRGVGMPSADAQAAAVKAPEAADVPEDEGPREDEAAETQDDSADVLVLGAWMSGASAADLLDYDALEDQLVVIFDDSGEDEEPEVDMRASADDPAITEILLNGTVLTALPTQDAPDPDGLVLVGESVAAALGLG